jgi:lysyl-tRNA synthetase class I
MPIVATENHGAAIEVIAALMIATMFVDLEEHHKAILVADLTDTLNRFPDVFEEVWSTMDAPMRRAWKTYERMGKI